MLLLILGGSGIYGVSGNLKELLVMDTKFCGFLCHVLEDTKNDYYLCDPCSNCCVATVTRVCV